MEFCKCKYRHSWCNNVLNCLGETVTILFSLDKSGRQEQPTNTPRQLSRPRLKQNSKRFKYSQPRVMVFSWMFYPLWPCQLFRSFVLELIISSARSDTLSWRLIVALCLVNVELPILKVNRLQISKKELFVKKLVRKRRISNGEDERLLEDTIFFLFWRWKLIMSVLLNIYVHCTKTSVIHELGSTDAYCHL